MPETPKHKLTLSVDAEVIKRAKEMGFNLSEITESVLRSFAFSQTESSRKVVRQKYAELFALMLPLLKSYDTKVQVSKTENSGEIGEEVVGGVKGTVEYLTYLELFPNGSLQWADSKREVLIEDIDPEFLLEPNDILQNFVTAIADADKLSERIEGIEMAKKIVEVISQSIK